jgi:uncharacterized protein YecE (DUF72 family)
MPIHIGTSGYSYKDWKGPFYPEKTRPQEMLGLYAGRFDTVELNFSYYRQPDPRQLERMAASAGAAKADFTFSIKAYKGMTHEITPDWPAAARQFREATLALAEAKRLAAVLLQFPYSFHYTVQNRRHLDALTQRLEGLPLACEFRCREWLTERVYEGLRERNVALVAVDEPQLDGLLPPVAVPTADLAYVRFHGRNQENWWRGDSASRYDYLYAEEELREWLPKISSLAAAAKTVFIYFNNHWRGQAAENAHDLRQLLRSVTE